MIGFFPACSSGQDVAAALGPQSSGRLGVILPSNGGELRSGKPASLRYRSTHFRTVRGQTSTASPTVFDVCPLATCHTIRSRPCGVAGNAYAPAHPEGGCKKRICTSDESVVRTPRLQRPCFPSHTRSCCAGRWATQLEPRQRASHLHRRPCAATALSRNWPLVQRRGDAAQRCGPRLPMTSDSIGCVMFRIVTQKEASLRVYSRCTSICRPV